MTVIDIPSSYEYDDETLNHLQNLELNILKDFIEICDKNDLHYVVYHGTALGAVRHNGFIPWDDEIDILMTRKDYEKFLKTFKNENEKYYLSNWHTEINVDGKYLTPKTLFCLKTTRLSALGDTGIYIDINVIDDVPENKFKRTYFLKKIRTLIYLMNLIATIQADRYTSKNKERIGHCLGVLFNLIHFTPNFIAKSFTKTIQKYHEKSELVVDMSAVEKPMPKQYFDESIPIKFEDINVNIPTEYDAILKNFYGDYMKLPPLEERNIHSYGEIDFGDYKLKVK